MATQIIKKITDDLDGSDADETIQYGIDGATYSVDLNSANAAKLREALAPFIAVSRKEGGTKRPTRTRNTGDIDTKAVRLWAADNGIPVNTRGRLQADVVEKYLAAH